MTKILRREFQFFARTSVCEANALPLTPQQTARLPNCQAINKEYYLSVMRRLREAIRLKRPELWANNSWFLHHDNAPSHTALVLRDHFVKNSTHIVPQPPYSPDLSRMTSGFPQNSGDHSGERVSSRLTR